MSSLNKVCLIGNVGKDPEIRRLNSGDPVANFSLALTEKWKDKNTGEKREKTEWVNIVVFGNLCSVIENYVKKGDKLYVEGKLQTRKWQDQSGADRYTTEVVLQGFGGTLIMLGSPNGAGRDAGADQGRAREAIDEFKRDTGGGTRQGDLDDEIPF